MMRTFYLLAILTALFVCPCMAQTFSGRVIDGITKLPVQGANVRLLDQTGHIVEADTAGFFTITYLSLPLTLEVSHIGYEKQRTIIREMDDKVIVSLYPSGQELEE